MGVETLECVTGPDGCNMATGHHPSCARYAKAKADGDPRCALREGGAPALAAASPFAPNPTTPAPPAPVVPTNDPVAELAIRIFFAGCENGLPVCSNLAHDAVLMARILLGHVPPPEAVDVAAPAAA